MTGEAGGAISGAAGIQRVLASAMERDPRVVVLGESVGRLGGAHRATRGLLERFGPERVIDAPLSESGLIGLAVGMAMAGRRPVVELAAADRLTAAADGLARELARIGGEFSAPVVIRAPVGGPFDRGAPAAWLAGLGLQIGYPSSAADATGLLRAALDSRGPSVLLEPLGVYSDAAALGAEVGFGQAALRAAPAGAHASILTWGAGVAAADAAADALAAGGYRVEILDLRSLAPLDRGAIAASVQRTGRAVVADPGDGSFGGALLREVLSTAFLHLESPPVALTRPDAGALADAVTTSVHY